MICQPAIAKVRINTLLTTEGLNQEGLPVTFKRTFSLKEDRGVQYYVEWISDEKKHNIVIKWFGPNEQLISFLVLDHFSQNIVRDYISFKKKKKRQVIIPKQIGNYSIYLYIDQQLTSITKFKVIQ